MKITLPMTVAALPAALLLSSPLPGAGEEQSWRDDPAWYQGKAEWALYEAVRRVERAERHYEATIFTNKQRMDLATSVKAGGTGAPATIEVFKHNLSELIPTENYTYRFLTTCFVRTDTLEPYKVAFSSQEDCGSTYKQFVNDGRIVRVDRFCYLPGGGARPLEYPRPDALAFQDALSFTLRDYPFDGEDRPVLTLALVPDQTDSHETSPQPAEAKVHYVQRETITVPYGAVETHHLRLTHQEQGRTTTSDYWFAADPGLRHVMVQYEGPYGVRYRLKRLAWWAYWREPRPPA